MKQGSEQASTTIEGRSKDTDLRDVRFSLPPTFNLFNFKSLSYTSVVVLLTACYIMFSLIACCRCFAGLRLYLDRLQVILDRLQLILDRLQVILSRFRRMVDLVGLDGFG